MKLIDRPGRRFDDNVPGMTIHVETSFESTNGSGGGLEAI